MSLRLSYVLLPAIILVSTLVLVAWFYRLLPAATAFSFDNDGGPKSLASRSTVVFMGLALQALLALVAVGIAWGIKKVSSQAEGGRVNLEPMIRLMGNMLALPQAVIFFALLDIFSYNAYQAHLLPLWVSTLTIAIVGGIVLGVFFIRTFWKVCLANKE